MQTQEMRIRVPNDLRKWIEAKAASEERSMNWQIIDILKSAKNADKPGNER